MPSARSIPNLVPVHEATYPHASLLTLTDDVTYYVNGTTGDDNNDGLTALTPFATIGKAMGLLPETVLSNVIINVAAGTYAETIWFNKRCVRDGQQGYITVQGDSTWTTYSTATILSVEAEDRGHRVKFNRTMPAAEQGLRILFTDGNQSGNNAWLTYIDPADRTEAIISMDMTAVTSRAVTLQTPSVIISGDGTHKPIEIDRAFDECYHEYSGVGQNQSYAIKDLDIVQTPVGGSYVSINLRHGTLLMEDCLFDGLGTSILELPMSVEITRCSAKGNRLIDLLVMSFCEHDFTDCSFSVPSGWGAWNSLTRFTDCTFGPGSVRCWDNTYLYITRCFGYKCSFNTNGNNCTVYFADHVSSGGSYTAQVSGGVHNAVYVYGGIISGDIAVYYGTHCSLSFESCELSPPNSGDVILHTWEDGDSTHNSIKLYDVTYTNSPKALIGPLTGEIALATLPPSIVSDAAVFSCINKMEV